MSEINDGPMETLRAAAAKLRETAEGTSVPPWYADGIEGVYAYGAPGEPCPQVFVDRRVRYQDVLWMALVHPGIAHPLADWLDDAAREAGEIGPNHRAVEFAWKLLGVPNG